MVSGSDTRVIVIGNDTTTFGFSRDKNSTWTEWPDCTTTYSNPRVDEIERKAIKEQEKIELKKLEHQKKIRELQKLDRKFLHSRKI
jgi:hypothetical protein